ncbi:F-box/kelch-repeat protein At3g23880-like [Lycium ferocissimum]|uniref:F-box/kelch-repeat protein At3g23880-like n=1 Tax=Lycium ferocissimum TaxID=112874 RepID=UPI002814DF6A|nr:F-box/kelch-repeat protein At3g23880-like [Lycium ferocissimum]XP_059293594.1 F-box/kelch-repeat protein At3g23880-like [Lycium ferocissimum]XP_059293603.1 F-box/kelch-repeat protein At3g23880-like [Lycium ferocissimum]
MGSKGNDPKRSKPTNHSPFPSTSMQFSSLSIPTLPPELITEILSRLPVKSLLKFRCVSKYWLDVISSPEFIKTHLSLSFNNKEYTHNMFMFMFDRGLTLQCCTLRSLFYQPVTEAFDLDYPMKGNDLYTKLPRSDWILGSVNGLICLAAGKNDLFIGNPSIRKYRKLPDPRPRLKKFVSSPIYSFGYDEFHDDYKVVGVFYSYDSSDHAEVKIYSLKSDSWRSLDDCPSEVLLVGSGKFLNGKFHWDVDGKIISFDLGEEKWGKTMKQPCYGEGDFVIWLTVLASDLSIFCDYMRTLLDVWVMKEYGVKESWTKMYTINCPGDEVDICHLLCPLLFTSKKGEILVVFGSVSMIYNPKDESIRYSEVINNFDGDYEAEIYVESLVSPFSTQGLEDARKRKSLKNIRSR